MSIHSAVRRTLAGFFVALAALYGIAYLEYIFPPPHPWWLHPTQIVGIFVGVPGAALALLALINLTDEW